MRLRLAVTVSLQGTLLLGFCIALTSCPSRPADTRPAIEFSKIPPAAQGGRERVDTIAGHVKNACPGQQIVIYARSGPWWVQPWPDRPLIPIQADSTWSTETHLGFEYAALLVDPDYRPPTTMDVAPTQGGLVALVRVVKGTGTPQFAPTGSLKFSGYDWGVRMIASDKGGTNNPYDPDNAWTDASGALHLQIKKKSCRWSCAEIFLTRDLGYGTYAVTVRDTSQLEPAAVFSMFTFEDRAVTSTIRRWTSKSAAGATLRKRITHSMWFNLSTSLETCSRLPRRQVGSPTQCDGNRDLQHLRPSAEPPQVVERR